MSGGGFSPKWNIFANSHGERHGGRDEDDRNRIYRLTIFHYPIMYRKTLLGSIVTLFLLLATSGCSKVEIVYHYVRLPENTCSFDGANNAPQTLKVNASPTDFTYELSDQWIQVVDQTEKSITVNVLDNPEREERSGTITLHAGQATGKIYVYQMRKMPSDDPLKP